MRHSEAVEMLKGITNIFTRIDYGIRGRIHLRHWRGRRIHSPFMYSVVREVFMQGRVTGGSRELYNDLRNLKVSRRNSVTMQNLYTHCGLQNYSVMGENVQSAKNHGDDKCGRTLCILLPSVNPIVALETARNMKGGEGILAVLSPHKDGKLRRVSCRIWNELQCVSVERRLMRIYFFDTKLQSQHYRI